MGLSSFLKNKLAGQKDKYKQWGTEDPEVKAAKEAAYREGRLQRAQKEGLAKGLGPQYSPPAPGQRTGGRKSASWSPDWKTAGNMFSGGGGAGNYDPFGMGGVEKPKAAPPMRTTRISRSGQVTIQEQIQPSTPKQESQSWDPWVMPGAYGGMQKQRKKGQYEKDPHDFIL